jgi:hypothetical protein
MVGQLCHCAFGHFTPGCLVADALVAAPMRRQTLTHKINGISTNRASATNCSQVGLDITSRARLFSRQRE